MMGYFSRPSSSVHGGSGCENTEDSDHQQPVGNGVWGRWNAHASSHVSYPFKQNTDVRLYAHLTPFVFPGGIKMESR